MRVSRANACELVEEVSPSDIWPDPLREACDASAGALKMGRTKWKAKINDYILKVQFHLTLLRSKWTKLCQLCYSL